MSSIQRRASAAAVQEVRELAAALSAQARWMRANGVVGVPWAQARIGSSVDPSVQEGPSRAVASVERAPSKVARDAAVAAATAASAASPAEPVATAPDTPNLESVADLGALREAIGECRRCALSGSRSQIVFGVGNPQARLVFVGEAPGREEDRRGEPFVGAAGALLTDIIEKGMRLTRADVYICNVVKCRPPGNRDPEPAEVGACAGFLAKQIELVRPEVIVALGRVAAQSLLGSANPISRLRGRWVDYRGIPLMPTLHPAYLLRNPEAKRLVWEDIKQVMARLGVAR